MQETIDKMANKAQTLFTSTEAFKEALATYAQNHHVSVAWVIREAVSQYIKYDLSAEEIVDGRRKYASKEERQEAQKLRSRTERAEVAKLLAALEKEQRLLDAAGIEASLIRRGVNPND